MSVVRDEANVVVTDLCQNIAHRRRPVAKTFPKHCNGGSGHWIVGPPALVKPPLQQSLAGRHEAAQPGGAGEHDTTARGRDLQWQGRDALSGCPPGLLAGIAAPEGVSDDGIASVGADQHVADGRALVGEGDPDSVVL